MNFLRHGFSNHWPRGCKISSDEDNKLENIETEITKEIADRELEKLIKVTGDLDDEPNLNIWKEMRKSFPKKCNLIPTGVMNMEGKLITNPSEKKSVTLNHFENRMRKRKVKEEVEDLIKTEESVFRKRIREAEKNVSTPFEMEELDKVLKNLKTGKCKDPDNFIFDLFKDGVSGSDLIKSILMLVNKIKLK